VSRTLFLGVDGGGTKTHFVLVDRDGNLAAWCEGPTSYHLEVGMDGVRDVLTDGVAALLRQAGIDGSAIGYAFFGLPAHGEDSVAEALLDALPEPLLGHRRYRCGNDMVCAWAGSLGGDDGINIVAGTGSIGYGERRGRSARAGGWGEVFGDEGSAYWIAVQGLNVFTRMSDGRLPRGPLHAMFRASLGLSDDLDICAKVMNAHPRSSIAAMSELSYSGGVFNARALILGPLQHHLAAQSSSYRLQAPITTPSVGAAVYAAKLAAQPLSVPTMQRLASNLRSRHIKEIS
jgi:N-acetylglucosamine kinase-like BadF-type ATPase